LTEQSGLLAIADGCGGMASGELAAKAAIESLESSLHLSSEPALPLRTVVLDAFEKANRHVLEVGSGAATTLAVVEIDGSLLRTYHVGDSAILLLGNRGRVRLMTTSHSPVGYAVQAGMLDEHEAIHHEDRHLVSNVIGTEHFHIEIGSKRKMHPRDTLVIGSDGLFDNLLLNEVVELVRKGPLDRAATRLAQLACERMDHPTDNLPSKPDDLTFLLFRPGRKADVAPA
jgi:serine/threonine protein phosphatase PrpC